MRTPRYQPKTLNDGAAADQETLSRDDLMETNKTIDTNNVPLYTDDDDDEEDPMNEDLDRIRANQMPTVPKQQQQNTTTKTTNSDQTCNNCERKTTRAREISQHEKKPI